MAPRPQPAPGGRRPQRRRGAGNAGPTAMPPAPSAAKMAAENGIDLAGVEGSGKRGQVLKGDVLAAIAGPRPRRRRGAARSGAPAPAPARAASGAAADAMPRAKSASA